MKIKIIILISIIIFLFSVSKVEYPYKAGVLYSQSQLSRYKEKQYENNKKLVNRNEAIRIATYILKDVLGIDTTIGDPTINVEIYRSGEKEYTYNWNIWWARNDYSINYGVEINSITGEILSIYIRDVMPVKNTNLASELTDDEILSIVKPLTDQLEIDLNFYDLKITNVIDYNMKGIKTLYKHCLFENKSNEKFEIVIDSGCESIVNYKKNPFEEVEK